MSRSPLVHAPGLAITWMVVASIAFASMGAIIKWTAGQMDVWVVILGRSLITAALAFSWMRARGLSFRLGDPRWMFLRCAAGFTAMAAYFHAIQTIPLANAIALQYTSPLFIALLSGAVLGERVNSRIVPAMIASFIGAACIVAPTLQTINLDALIALGSAVLPAIAYLAVRALRTTDSPDNIIFWFALFASLGAIPGGAEAIPALSGMQWGALVGIGLAGTLGQIGLTRAYHHAPAAFTGAFSYTTILAGLAFGWLLHDESPTLADWAGVFLIIVSGVYLARGSGDKPPESDQGAPGSAATQSSS